MLAPDGHECLQERAPTLTDRLFISSGAEEPNDLGGVGCPIWEDGNGEEV